MKYLKIKNNGLLDIRLIALMGGTTKSKDKFKIGSKMKVFTDQLDACDLPLLPGMIVDVLADPSMRNKTTVVTYTQATVIEAFKLIRSQQRVIDGQMAKVIYMGKPHKNVA